MPALDVASVLASAGIGGKKSTKRTPKKVKKEKGLQLYPLQTQNTFTGEKGSGKTTLGMMYGLDHLGKGGVLFTNFRMYGAWWIAAAKLGVGGPAAWDALPATRQSEIVRTIKGNCFRFDDWDDLYAVRPFRQRGQSPEGRFLVVFDEAADRLNARTWAERGKKNKERYGSTVAEGSFIRQARKLGFRLLVISQSEQALDNQFRQQGGYMVALKNLGQTGYLGVRSPVSIFLAVYRWGGTGGSVQKRYWFRYPVWLSGYYDSWELFDPSVSVGLRYQYDPDYRTFVPPTLAPHPDDRRELGATGEAPRGESPSPALLPFRLDASRGTEVRMPWETVVFEPATSEAVV